MHEDADRESSSNDPLRVEGPADLPADTGRPLTSANRCGGKARRIHLYTDCESLGSDPHDWARSNTPSGRICIECADRHNDLPDGPDRAGGQPSQGRVQQTAHRAGYVYAGQGEVGNLFTSCPLCGHEFDHHEFRAQHFLEEHDPEDAGLSAPGERPPASEGPLFTPVEELPGRPGQDDREQWADADRHAEAD